MPSLFGVRRRDAGRQPENATWISGVVAGAGKLISSVFSSNDRSTTSSYSYSTDGADSNNNDENMVIASNEPDAPKQDERKLEPVKNFNGTSMAIISEIDSKDAIEQMIIQETFTRDEGHNLIKLIESRVVDPGNNVDIYKKVPEEITYPSGTSPFLELTPELRNSAVIEARKWLEDKRLALSSNVNSESRPSNMLPCDFGGLEGSPADVAKLYMQSLSPFSTPSLVSTPAYSEYASKGLKRNQHTSQSHSKVEEIRRVRLKSTDLACKMSEDNEAIRHSPSRISDKAILGSAADNVAQLTHETSSPTTLPSALNSSLETDTLNHNTAMQDNISEIPQTIDAQDLPTTDTTTLSQNIITVTETYNYSHSTIGEDFSRPKRRSSVRKKQSVPESSLQDGNSPVQGKENEENKTTNGSSARMIVDNNVDGSEKSNSARGGPRTRGGIRKSRTEKDPLYKPPQPSSASRGRSRKSVPKGRRGKGKRIA